MLKKTNDMGRTPLHTACVFKGSMGTISHLIKALPQVLTMKDVNGCTPLHLAAQEGYCSTVMTLLEYGAIVSFRDKYKETP